MRPVSAGRRRRRWQRVSQRLQNGYTTAEARAAGRKRKRAGRLAEWAATSRALLSMLPLLRHRAEELVRRREGRQAE